MRLAIVIPCYNEEAVLAECHERLDALLTRMVNNGQVGADSRLVFVDDGSTDTTWQLIADLHKKSERVCGVRLSGNRGHQNALMAGIDTARDTLMADAIVTIDADLQDDPDVIPLMVERFLAGNHLVLGVRRSRQSDSWFKRSSARLFYRLMSSLGARTVDNHADFRLISRTVALALRDYRERNLFLRGIIANIGFSSDVVYYDRTIRTAGESKYPLGKMMAFAIDGVTSFSVRPVRMVLSLGLLFLLIAVGMLVWVLAAYFTHRTVSGWSSLMLSIWFVGGCLLVALGIVGEYIGKIYLEVKNRPRYIIDRVLLHEQ